MLLWEVVYSIRQLYGLVKTGKETIEEFVNRYLREKVLKIWPDGWMKIEELLKEYEKRFVTRKNVAFTVH